MTKTDSDNSNDDHVWNAISAIHHIVEQDREANSLTESLAQLRDELLGKQAQEVQSGVFLNKIKVAALYKLIGNTPRLEACITWLRKTGHFSEKELRRIRRVGLLCEDKSGNVSVSENMLSLKGAAILLSVICLMAGMWIGWIVFGSQGNIQEIVISFALGTVFGSIISFVLDKSFRFKQVKDKVGSIAPWLIDSVGEPRPF